MTVGIVGMVGFYQLPLVLWHHSVEVYMVKDSLDIQAIWVHFTPITLFCNRIELNDQTIQQSKARFIKNTKDNIINAFAYFSILKLE